MSAVTFLYIKSFLIDILFELYGLELRTKLLLNFNKKQFKFLNLFCYKSPFQK